MNPLTLSSAAVTAYEPDAINRNPLILSSVAITVYDLAGSNGTSMDDSSLLRLRHTSVSLAADDLTGPAEDSAPVTGRPLRAHDAGRRPILDHDVCRDGEHEMEQVLAAAAAWPYAGERNAKAVLVPGHAFRSGRMLRAHAWYVPTSFHLYNVFSN